MTATEAAGPDGFIVRRLREVPGEDAAHLFDWGEDLWSIDCHQLSWRQWTWCFVGYLEGTPVSHVGTLTHTVTVADNDLIVGGLAAVLTLPHARERGYGKATLDAAVRFLHDPEDVPFVLLFCRDQLIPFYGPLGWQQIEDEVTIQQPDGDRPSPLNVLVRSLDGSNWPPGPIALNSQPW